MGISTAARAEVASRANRNREAAGAQIENLFPRAAATAERTRGRSLDEVKRGKNLALEKMAASLPAMRLRMVAVVLAAAERAERARTDSVERGRIIGTGLEANKRNTVSFTTVSTCAKTT